MRLLLLACTLLVQVTALQAQEKLLVFAPSSMTDVLDDVAGSFTKQSGYKVVFSVAGTPQLARQLDAGAPADLYITADREWMDWAIKRRLLDRESVFALVGNQLVVAVRREVENWADIDALLTRERFAMAEPDTVPAGRYARQSLENRGIWQEARKKAVFGDNVRTTLQRLVLGEVAAAIVYATDAKIEPSVRTLFTFPSDSHAPITYWAAATTGAKPEASRALIEYLRGHSAAAIFAKAGFVPPQEDGN